MINWFDMPAEGLSNGGLFEVKELEVTDNGTYETKGEMYNKVTVNVPSPSGKITITENGTDINIAQYAKADVNVEGGGGESDLTWILPEQTVTLADQPVEITGLRLDLIPNSVKSVPIKITAEEFGSIRTNYYSLVYSNNSLETTEGTISIFTQDGKNMFLITDGESIVQNAYTISIVLF